MISVMILNGIPGSMSSNTSLVISYSITCSTFINNINVHILFEYSCEYAKSIRNINRMIQINVTNRNFPLTHYNGLNVRPRILKSLYYYLSFDLPTKYLELQIITTIPMVMNAMPIRPERRFFISVESQLEIGFQRMQSKRTRGVEDEPLLESQNVVSNILAFMIAHITTTNTSSIIIAMAIPFSISLMTRM